MSLGKALRGLRALASLLTTLPLGPSTLEEAAEAFHLVPLVGLLEGVLAASAFYLSTLLGADPLLSGALLALVHVAITGGLHLDGFSDYADVIGAGARGDRAASILKDPCRGSFAIVAVALNLALTIAMAAQLHELSVGDPGGRAAAVLAVVLSYVLSAESLYLTLLYSGVEPYDGMAKLFSVGAKRRGLRGNAAALVLATLAPSALSSPWSSPPGVLLIAVAEALSMAASVSYVVRDSSSRMGYANGDVAGFAYELSRLSTLGASLVVMGLCSRL